MGIEDLRNIGDHGRTEVPRPGDPPTHNKAVQPEGKVTIFDRIMQWINDITNSSFRSKEDMGRHRWPPRIC